MLKIASLTTGLLAAGLFLTPLPASAAQIGVGAIPEATTTVETVQYGYGGYGRPHYGRRFYGGRGLGYGRHFHGGPASAAATAMVAATAEATAMGVAGSSEPRATLSWRG